MCWQCCVFCLVERCVHDSYVINLTVYHMLSFKECRVAVLLKGS
jgi:hypothetical protein